jgi:hypothetical protein
MMVASAIQIVIITHQDVCNHQYNVGQVKLEKWFKAKRFGWGWTPITWQGWSICALFALILIYSIQAHLIALSVISIVVMMIVCSETGEKPGWHWG